MRDLLRVESIAAGYGGAAVLRDVSIEVAEGEAVAVIGANGAGKSTLLRVIMGQVTPSSGRVTFRGTELGSIPPYARAQLGIGYVPEGRALFPELTVDENLLVGAHRAQRHERERRLHDILAVFPSLGPLRRTRCRLLSGGEQQMVTIGRALMAEPQLLILDEPSIGLAPKVVSGMYQVLRHLHRGGLSVLVAEQNAYSALRFAARGYVFEDGRVTRTAAASELLGDPSLIESYIGRAIPDQQPGSSERPRPNVPG